MIKESNNKSVIVITDYSLHQKNSAAFSRINCYKKSIGAKSEFYVLELCSFNKKYKNVAFQRCRESSILFSESEGNCDGYLYRNIMRIFDFIKPLRMIKYILKNFSREESAILLYSSHFFLFLSTIILKCIYHYKVVVEKNELELSIVLNISFPRNIALLPFLVMYPIRLVFAVLIDLLTYRGSCIVVISTNLQKLYRLHSRVYRIPILVDTQRFNPLSGKRNKSDSLLNFVYLGTFTKKKDAIFEILNSIQSMKHLLTDKAVFTFIGEGSKSIMQKMSNYIQKNDLQDLVIMKPKITSQKIPDHLSEYNFALLLRKSNLQTKYGFSTKLGEYLAAGLPVITNSISDNAMYLNDRKDSVFVRKVNTDEITRTIDGIVKMKNNELTEMQNASVHTAENYFDYILYRNHLKRILL